MRKLALGVAAAVSMVAASVSQAQVTQTLGAGSAVTTVHASASFESQNSLNDNPYLEGGMSFSRTNLTFNNNNCGFAGCVGSAALTGFSGNYMYGVGTGGSGFFTMKAATGQTFSGLEFMLGNGYFNSSSWSVGWKAFLNGNQVGTGSLASFNPGDVIGFSSVSGFDELQYTDLNSTPAPAFDEVRAQYGTQSVVPEPSTWALMAAGLLFVGGAARRKRRNV